MACWSRCSRRWVLRLTPEEAKLLGAEEVEERVTRRSVFVEAVRMMRSVVVSTVGGMAGGAV